MIGNVWEWTASDFNRIRDLLPVLTRSIRRRGLAITRFFAAVVGRLVRVSFTTAIEISTRPTVAMYGRDSAPVR